jgi:MoaA/NifB/PqqE/SkfB family radical SAM enzyme
MASIKEVKKNFPKLKVRVNTALTKYTIDSFPEFINFCGERDIEVQVGFLFKESPFASSVDKVKEMADFIYRKKREGAKIVASSDTLQYTRDWPFENEIWVTRERAKEVLGNKAKKCQYGSYEIIIDSNGNLYPCNALQGDMNFKPKNMKEVGFQEAFNHLQAKRCYTCNIASMIDTSQMINWNLKSIFERAKMEIWNI